MTENTADVSAGVLLCAVGDVAAFFSRPQSMFEHTAGVMGGADIVFGQNERHYTDRYSAPRDLIPGVPLTEIAPRSHAAALKLGRFDVVSFASNHCMDLGGDAMLDTIAALEEQGFAVIGAGRHMEAARKPAIVERKGTRVAFLGYCSVMRSGYEATVDRPGCAPMRATTFYQQVDHQPGTPPLIVTWPHAGDVGAMREDIAKVRSRADVVVVSFHWGIHFIPGAVAMYQREVAHAAIDAGADLIVGHHPHVLSGIEVYRGKAIFYSMGNFAFDLPLTVRSARQRAKAALGLEGSHRGFSDEADPKYAEWYSWGHESRRSMIVKCRISRSTIERVAFLPVMINERAQPVVESGATAVEDARAYMADLNAKRSLKTELSVSQDEIEVRT